MKNIANSVADLIGKTPLLELKRIKEKYGLLANIYAKVEYFNPTGSVKDRAAYQMLKDAEDKGIIGPGATIIEPTSGNTGIGLASLSAAKGYKAIIVMPDTMSVERRNLIKAYGAEIVLTDGKLGMKGAIAKAKELHENTPNSFIPSQFDNKANAFAHYSNTGPEIFDDLEGDIDAFVAGVGTGGTLTGVGTYLKEQKKDIKVIAVEPKTSAVLSTGIAGPHKIQGIGAGFVPSILDTTIYDEIITIENDEAFEKGRLIGKTEGILVGISSGAALAAAIQLAQREEFKDKNIVVLFPDSGDRYLSTPMFNFEV